MFYNNVLYLQYSIIYYNISFLPLLVGFKFEMDPKKETIKFYYGKKFSPYAIVKKLANLSISESKIYRVCRRLRQGQSLDSRHRSGRPRSARTALNIKRVRKRIRRKPLRSARKIAPEFDISNRSIRRILKEDLGLRTYKKHTLHGLSTAQTEKRLVRSRELLERHGNSDLEHIIFSDEKLFSVEERYNHQNSRIYALAIEDILEDMRTIQRFQNEKKLMGWCAISKKVKFPWFFVESSV